MLQSKISLTCLKVFCIPHGMCHFPFGLSWDQKYECVLIEKLTIAPKSTYCLHVWCNTLVRKVDLLQQLSSPSLI